MRKFEDFLKVILKQEGGDKFHKVAGDPGGATKFGISLRFLKDTEEGDFNKDGSINETDIKELTLEQASELYKKYFYNAANLNLIRNELLRLHVFSHAVNRGIKPAVRLLQRIVGAEQDGKLGKTTAMMINAVRDEPALVHGYASARKIDYEKLVANNPKLSKFLLGWYNRVDTTKF